MPRATRARTRAALTDKNGVEDSAPSASAPAKDLVGSEVGTAKAAAARNNKGGAAAEGKLEKRDVGGGAGVATTTTTTKGGKGGKKKVEVRDDAEIRKKELEEALTALDAEGARRRCALCL